MSNQADILLPKWLEGRASEAEIELLAQHYDLDYLTQLLNAQKSYGLQAKEDEEMWTAFQSKIKANEKSKPKKTRLYLLGFIALGIISFLLFIYLKPNTTKHNTSYEQAKSFAFEDGTTIDLSPNSQIEYNEANWNTERSVSLNGQAFFSVSKGKPFKVITPSGSVTVLGTQFDVWTINPDFMTVKCSEGSVSVSNNKTKKVIKGGEQVQIYKGKLSNPFPYKRTNADWQEEIREYENLPLDLLLKDLSRFYDSEFKINNPTDQDLFSGVIPIGDIEKTLRYLQRSTLYEYTKQGNDYIFTKE